jgi:hypothetical protein
VQCRGPFEFGFFVMSLSFEPADPRFLAIIDEAGDTGLAKVYPTGGSKGSSEWLIIGALVVRLEREPELIPWVRDIREKIRSRQAPALHYRDLNPDRKTIVCHELAQLPVRCFVLCSNKKNMQGHKNDRVEAARGASTQEYFYNWCVRLLLERVTKFIEAISLREFGAPKHLQIIFSERGGLRYAQTIAYLDLLRQQARSHTTYLATREIKWPIIHPKLITSIPHQMSAGAQLADVIPSAFFEATNTTGKGSLDTSYAKLLKRRMSEHNRVFENRGVSLQPWPYRKANLNERQKEIFRFYGFRL